MYVKILSISWVRRELFLQKSNQNTKTGTIALREGIQGVCSNCGHSFFTSQISESGWLHPAYFFAFQNNR